MARSIFSGITKVRPRMDAVYDGPGVYLQRIDKVKEGENWQGTAFFAIEKTVIHVIDNAEGHVNAHKVGDSPTSLYKTDNVMFNSLVSGFVKGVLDEDLSQTTPEEAEKIMQQLVSDDQPLTGTVVETKARQRMSKKGQEITSVTFVREVPPSELVEILTPEEIEKFYPGDMLSAMIAAEKKAEAESKKK